MMRVGVPQPTPIQYFSQYREKYCESNPPPRHTLPILLLQRVWNRQCIGEIDHRLKEFREDSL